MLATLILSRILATIHGDEWLTLIPAQQSIPTRARVLITDNMPTLSNQEQIRYIRDFNGDGKSDILTQTASVLPFIRFLC